MSEDLTFWKLKANLSVTHSEKAGYIHTMLISDGTFEWIVEFDRHGHLTDCGLSWRSIAPLEENGLFRNEYSKLMRKSVMNYARKIFV